MQPIIYAANAAQFFFSCGSGETTCNANQHLSSWQMIKFKKGKFVQHLRPLLPMFNTYIFRETFHLMYCNLAMFSMCNYSCHVLLNNCVVETH